MEKAKGEEHLSPVSWSGVLVVELCVCFGVLDHFIESYDVGFEASRGFVGQFYRVLEDLDGEFFNGH